MEKFILILFFSLISILSAEETSFLILDLKTENLLGSTKAGKFYTHKETYAKVEKLLSQDTFIVYGINNTSHKEIQLKTLKKADNYCTDRFAITTNSKKNRGIALSNKIDWNPIPRKINPLATNSKVYNKVVKDFLISKGIKDPKISIRQLFRTDLDNDGQGEVVIVATHSKSYLPNGQYFDSRFAEFGDYSFILVRKIIKGKVKNILLGGSFQAKTYEDPSQYVPDWYELSSILDLNGDGTMEIIVYSFYYEGSFTTAYTLKKGESKMVLGAGCGS